MHKITFEKIKSLFFELQDRLLSFYWRKTVNHSKIDGHVLMYHHITDQCIDELPSCVRTISAFEKGLDEEIKAGYHPISVQDFLEIIRNKKECKFCVVTFDDVPSTFVDNAYPFLKKNSIPFTLFITTNYLDSEGYLSKEQIIELDQDSLCTIGAHTVSHPLLKNSEDPYAELYTSKIQLEQLLGHGIEFMAYPYGKHSSISRKIRRLTDRAGYECAFSTIDAPITDCSINSVLFLPRIVI